MARPPRARSAADLITLLNGVETEGEEPIAQATRSRSPTTGSASSGSCSGSTTPGTSPTLTNLLIRITDLLVPALEEARQRHVEILQTERDVC
jgi:hypothetical protein